MSDSDEEIILPNGWPTTTTTPPAPLSNRPQPESPRAEPPWPNHNSFTPTTQPVYGIAANATGHAYFTRGIEDRIFVHPFFVRVTPPPRARELGESLRPIPLTELILTAEWMVRMQLAHDEPADLPTIGDVGNGYWFDEEDGVLMMTSGRVTEVGTMTLALVTPLNGEEAPEGLQAANGTSAQEDQVEDEDEEADVEDVEASEDDEDNEDEQQGVHILTESVELALDRTLLEMQEDYFPDGDGELYGRNLDNGTRPSLGFR
ncbi:uncharacterized protein BDV17DRAFT_288414 [Aspergillus undulatus]|uniref:uncharacterized protein n=1 Tax=Aspergillus undulatus TaxID=1810928 RepID=UPI003CCCA972